MALIFYQPGFWLVFTLLGLTLVGLALRQRLRWWPALPLRLGMVFLALMGIFSPRGEIFRRDELPGREVLVVEQSQFLSAAERTRLREAAQLWQASGANRVVVVAGERPAAALNHQGDWPQDAGRDVDLAGAITMGANLLGSQPGTFTLAVSGRAASSVEAEAALGLVKQAGHRLQLLPVSGLANTQDSSITGLDAPAMAWQGSVFTAGVSVALAAGAEVQALDVQVNGKGVTTKAEKFGEGYYLIRDIPAEIANRSAEQRSGILTLSVMARISGDPNPANNRYHTSLQVFLPPRVLYFQDKGDLSDSFTQSLRKAGLIVDVLPPEKFPMDLGVLNNYQVIFVDNLMANRFTTEQMVALQLFVTQNAGSLFFLGGRSSYTLGGYQNTLIEPMLPVKLTPPPRPQRPPVVFLLVIDRSGSMGVLERNGVMPLQLAKEAAMRAAETLKAQDYLGVLVFDDQSQWIVPIQPVGEGLAMRQKLDAISTIISMGGTHIYEALQQAQSGLNKLSSGTPPSRYALLLTDGQSDDGSPDLFSKISQEIFQKSKTTLSTIALGLSTDIDELKIIAEAGKGRFYQVSSAVELPKVMVTESRAGRSENTQPGETRLKSPTTDHPTLFGLSEQDLPTLTEYNALTSRKDEGAEDILVSASFEDPILSAWRYGLGWVIAWMGDSGKEWSGAFSSPAGQAAFWSQVIRYTLPNPAVGPIQAEVTVGETGITVEASLQDFESKPVNLADVSLVFSPAEAEIAGTGGAAKPRQINIPQSNAGVYNLGMERLPEASYRAVLAYSYKDASGKTQQGNILLPFSINYPEYMHPGSLAQNAAALRSWAITYQIAQVDDSTFTRSDKDTVPKDPVPETDSWLWLIVLGLALLWPVDIALRRRWLPWVR